MTSSTAGLTKSLLLVCLLASLGQAACATSLYAKTTLTHSSSCSATLGHGSNLSAQGIYYKGKCEGDVVAPALLDGDGVVFKALGGSDTGSDRSELADTAHQMSPGTTYYITASIRIPPQSAVTHDFFYVLQLWQGSSFSPSAGIRINRGTSHQASLMVRNKNDVNGHGIASIDFSDNDWHSFIIKVRMTKGDDGVLGLITPDGEMTEWKGKVGFSDDDAALPVYRLKFGIYKGAEAGRSFEVHERKVKVFKKLDDAHQYLASDVVF